MSLGNPEGFPWGDNNPGTKARMVVAFVIALAGTLVLSASFAANPGRHTDFSNVWFGASMLLKGIDPYPLLGPGRAFNIEYPLLYPASSFVLVLPFGFLAEETASIVFTGVSLFLLVYAITSNGWHRLPMLASAAFFDSLLAAQWTMIITAALFLPWLSFVTPAKPQNGLPVIAAERSLRPILIAGGTSAALLIASLFLLPGWPREWLSNVRDADYVRSPLMTVAGLPVLLVLLRWKRAESWLVLISAALPQTLMWYSALALLTVARTYREMTALSIISTAGFFASATAATLHFPHIGIFLWTFFVGTTYLPCVALILTRENEGPSPAWLSFFLSRTTIKAGR